MLTVFFDQINVGLVHIRYFYCKILPTPIFWTVVYNTQNISNI